MFDREDCPGWSTPGYAQDQISGRRLPRFRSASSPRALVTRLAATAAWAPADWCRAAWYIARDRDLPPPTQRLGNGANGIAWATTHPRQVVKWSMDPAEGMNWLALKNPRLSKKIRRWFVPSVAVFFLGPRSFLVWKGRADPDPGVDASEVVGPDAHEIWIEDAWENSGYLGKRRRPVTFDAYLPASVIEEYADPQYLSCW